jgi:hypothetical protein
MTVSLKHKFTNPKSDGGDSTIVRPSNWNDEHDLLMATARLLGRTTAGTGAAEEISASSDLSLSGGTLGLASSISSRTFVDIVLEGAIDEEEFTITDTAGFEINPANGSLQKITLGANRTPAAAPGGWTAGKGLLLKIADGTAYTITWSTLGVTWVGGSAPTLATTGWTVVALWKDADAIYGKHVGDVA